MIRVLLDTNVLVSGLLAPSGAPAAILDAWGRGLFEVVASPQLLDELEDVLARPKIRRHIAPADAAAFVSWVRRTAIPFDDPPAASGLTPDPGDDFVVALARSSRCELIVSGDAHLAALKNADPPVLTPRAFLEAIESK